MSLKIILFYGSVRRDRQGIRAARFVERSLRARGHEVSFVDALELQLPLLDRMYKEYSKGEAPAVLESLATLYRAADAFVIVTGEYNHSVPPALTNLLDHFLEEYFFRPSAIVSYSGGQFAGVRAAVHLQALLCELGMPSISRTFPVPRVGSAFDEEGNELTPGAGRRFDRFAAELEWYAEALKRQRHEKGVPY
ncbi:MAG TPA: NADPH-dependent FMN reductase [Vicinamibacterales bacterium]|jgi:NAD(P)H-dependent FMN reductase|nr:NADPH-dependent FMN reductase [Vicinamibacterales bacterium]